jgi:catechol 2,3-dioxygenase-like lactoylglutathione lyase family enzyme
MITGFDHVAFPVSSAETTLTFYRNLGFGIWGEEAWRAGEQRYFSIVFGDNKINIHPEALALERDRPGTLRAPSAEPGCADLCFVWSGGVDDLVAHLAGCGIATVAGPVERMGGRNRGTTRGTSIYIRDPDENLLEFICYDSTG